MNISYEYILNIWWNIIYALIRSIRMNENQYKTEHFFFVNLNKTFFLDFAENQFLSQAKMITIIIQEQDISAAQRWTACNWQ